MGCGASQAEAPQKKLYSFKLRLIGGLNLFNNSFGIQIPGTKTSAFNFNGASDPYVTMECGKNFHKSKTILHEQNPVWNEEFIFVCETKKPVIKFSVYDADGISQDDCIGRAEVPLFGLLGRKEREAWVPLTGAKANGELGFSVIECYRTRVTAKQGVNVKPMDSFSGTSDCYLTISVGQQARQKTAVKGWTLNPVWNQAFTFYVPYGVESQLEIILWDHDKIGTDNNMGWAYTKFDGKPKKDLQEIKSKITNAEGTLEFSIADDETCEVADVPAATAAELKALPPTVPQTCTFQCRVVGAYNLAAADHDYVQDMFDAARAEFFHEYRQNTGTSDPFAFIECEGQKYSTRHINNTLEPWWNEKFRFVARSKNESSLAISVWDHDIVSNDCIGRVTIPLNMLKPGERTELWSFLDKGRGELGLEMEMDFQLKVRVVEAKNLPAKDMNGMCDPYVKLTLAGKTYQTRVIRDNRSPWIEEDFRWAIPTLKNQKLQLTVYDSDFMIFKKGISEDLIGQCEIPLDNLLPGVANDMTLPLTLTGQKAAAGAKNEGTIRLIITSEIPVPQSALDMLAEKGKQAFDDAMKKLTETKDLIKTLKLPDFDKKEEAQLEPCDPKIADRPRFSRMKVKLVAARGLVGVSSPQIYAGVSVPLQGERYKTGKEYSEGKNPDFGEDFTFRIPTKTTSALQVQIFESNKHSYTGPFSAECHSKASLPLAKFNGGSGLIRGSQANDTWMDLDKGGQVVVRVEELFRFNVRVLSAEGISIKTDPYISVEFNKQTWRTTTVPINPAKDRSQGVPGKPAWGEQFTFFADAKGVVTFRLMDDNLVSADQALAKATFDLAELRRGVPKEVKLKLDKGGELNVWLKEEEKMALIDQVFDAAANAAKLASAAAKELAAKAQELVPGSVGEGIGKLGGAIGGLFGK